MLSTFANLETAKRGMMTHQLALNTTGHNISNASTEGYTRQRVNFTTTIPWPAIGVNRPQIPGQLGTGVKAGTIDRIRDFYLDAQLRNKTPDFGYWDTRATALARVEDIVNEPSDAGLSKVLNSFWESIQDVTTRPSDLSARQVMLERAKGLKETFAFMSTQTTTAREEIGLQADVHVETINTLLESINTLNQQIMELEVVGYKPNDLYDERDNLVDQLSSIVPIEVERNNIAEKQNPTADGTYTISLVQNDGTKFTLVDGKTMKYAEVSLQKGGQPAAGAAATEYDYFQSITVTDPNGGQNNVLDLENFNKRGGLFASIEAYGYVNQQGQNGTNASGVFYDKLKKLDEMAFHFVREFNAIHANGIDLDGNQAAADNSFFNDIQNEFGAAQAVEIALTDPRAVAAATKNSTGNNENAKALADFILSGNVGKSSIDANGNPIATNDGPGYHLKSEIESLVSQLGVDAQEANRMAYNTLVLVNTATNNRLSVTGVLLDEEFVDLVRFQHAYNGNARMITVVDEILDKIINGMGVVGR